VDTATCSTAASHKTPIDTAILTKSSGAGRNDGTTQDLDR